MTRLLTALTLATAIGCTGIQPVGPLAKKDGPSGKPGQDAAPTEPISVPAVKPTPPLSLVTPEEVDRDPHVAAQRLMAEFEADRKNMPKAPMTAEVSRYKNGVKQ